MATILDQIIQAKKQNKKLLAILLDPDKVDLFTIELLIQKINQSPATHVFIGGSLVENNCTDQIIKTIKRHCALPIVLFPGHPSQISFEADGILFLSLISGRNPDYLIEHQVRSARQLFKSNLEVVPTAYLLIESGHETAVQKVSKTTPLATNDAEKIVATAIAGQLLGMKLVYLEAGSGASKQVPLEVIAEVSAEVDLPIIVGGGIRSIQAIRETFAAGADLVVIGTAFENDQNFFNES